MQLSRNGHVQRSAAQWREIMARYRQSGRGSRDFCTAEGLVPRTFEKWERPLRRQEGTTGQFVEIAAPSRPQRIRGRWRWNSPMACGYGYEGTPMWFTPEVRRILAYIQPVDLRKLLSNHHPSNCGQPSSVAVTSRMTSRPYSSNHWKRTVPNCSCTGPAEGTSCVPQPASHAPVRLT